MSSGKRDRRAIAHPLVRLVLPAPACVMSSTGDGAPQEGDDDIYPFLYLLLSLLTKQFASGLPIFSNFGKVGKTFGRGDALKSITNCPKTRRGPWRPDAPNPFPTHFGADRAHLLSSTHCRRQQIQCCISHLKKNKKRQKQFLATAILAV